MTLTPSVIGEFYQGQPFLLAIEFRDKSDHLYDATAPKLTFYNDVTGATVHLVGDDLTHEETGEYLAAVALLDAGEWTLRVYDDVDLGDSLPYTILIAEDRAYGR